MKRTVLLAAVLTVAFSAGACAGILTSSVWTAGTPESFTAYDPVNPLLPSPENISYIEKVLGQSSGGQKNCSYDPWENWQLPQFRGFKEGGTNNVERLDVSSATYALRAAWRGMDGTADTDAYDRVSFRIKTQATTAADYTINIVASNNTSLYEGSNAVPLWDVSNLSVRPHVRTGWDTALGNEWIGADASIADGLWHGLDVAYNLGTGEAEWYVDGGLIGTLPIDPLVQGYFLGRSANNLEFWQKSGGLQSGNILVDDFVFYSGVVPEPSSLLALGTFGIGMLGLIRRRKA